MTDERRREKGGEDTLRELHAELLARMWRVFSIVIPVFVVAAVARAIVGSGVTPSFWFYLAGLGALCAATRSNRLPTRRRMGIVTVLWLALALAALLTFGSTIGVGMVFSLATLLAVFSWGGVGLVIALVILVVGSSVIIIASHETGHPLPGPQVAYSAWPQIGVSVVGVGALFGAMFLTIQRSFLRAISAEEAARQRERHAEQQRTQALQANMRAQRLESLGRLAGGVAHDVNNALMAVQLGGENLADDLRKRFSDHREDSAVEKNIELIQAGVSRATATVAKLLAFSKDSGPASGDFCQVRDVIPALLRTVASALPETIVVEWNGDDSTQLATISAPQLEQCLLNLILNARDAMPEGGTLSLSVTFDAEEVQDVLVVRDTGVGMEPEVVDRVFEPFYTTKGDEDGTGLGLAMVWGTVASAGGRIAVESTPGHGTTFTMRLPCERSDSLLASAQPREERQFELGGMKVLVVEDEPLLLRGLTAALRSAGASTLEASSARAAQEVLDAESEVHLLMTDVVMPGGGVVDLIEHFHAQHPSAPVVVCSGYTAAHLPSDLLAESNVTFLRKPVERELLLQVIGTLLTA